MSIDVVLLADELVAVRPREYAHSYVVLDQLLVERLGPYGLNTEQVEHDRTLIGGVPDGSLTDEDVDYLVGRLMDAIDASQKPDVRLARLLEMCRPDARVVETLLSLLDRSLGSLDETDTYNAVAATNVLGWYIEMPQVREALVDAASRGTPEVQSAAGAALRSTKRGSWRRRLTRRGEAH